MDRFCQAIAQEDGDLMLSEIHGVAWQRDQSKLVSYDDGYFNKCASYEGSEIANAINRGRVELVARHYCPVSPVLDVGIGSGEFIRSRQARTYGYDVNPKAVAWLRESGLWAEEFDRFRAFTMWDVIEHVPDPGIYLRVIQPGSYLFTSIPVFHELSRIRESKHYRPGEHLYYWTREGFIHWADVHGFDCLDVDDFETRAGRESILSFVLRKR